MASTPLILMSSNNEPNPNSNRKPTRPEYTAHQNPAKPRSVRKSSKAQKKQPQRGMGVAQLEQVLREQAQGTTNRNPFGVNPLEGVPVQPGRFTRNGFQVHPQAQQGPARAPGPRSMGRAMSGPDGFAEIPPPRPNLQVYLDDHSTVTLSFKKSRVIGDDLGFLRARETHANQILPNNGCNLSGFDVNNGNNHHYLAVNGDLSSYDTGSEVVAIHRKGKGSGNLKMEYEFFPQENGGINIHISSSNSCGSSSSISWDNSNNYNYNYYDNNNYNDNNNYKKEDEDLDLKMGCLDSSSSPSSLSSITTGVTTTTGCASDSVDLSLKLSY